MAIFCLLSVFAFDDQAQAQSNAILPGSPESRTADAATGSNSAAKLPGGDTTGQTPPSPASQSQNSAAPDAASPNPVTTKPADSGLASDSSALPELGKLQNLEQRLFSRAFTLDSSTDRLKRLEKFVFGVEGKGDTSSRLEKLNKIFAKQDAASANSASAQAATTVPAAKAGSPKALLSIINQGIDNYNRHRFHNAEDDFNEALNFAPGMSRIHVYLGSTLLQLNQRQSALDAMNAAYELDPFGTYGRYAKHCLIVLMGDEEVRKRGPKDNLKIVQKTLDIVNKHADLDAQRQQSIGQNFAASRSYANYSPTRDPQYANDMAVRRAYIHTDSMVQQAHARQEGAQRAANTQEAANNLKSLITAKLMPGDAKLRAFGTTLNARYYGDDTYNLAPWYIPREAPLELKAQPLSLKAAKPAKAGKMPYTKATGARASKHSHRQSASRHMAKKKAPLHQQAQRRTRK